jgi:hypothetical protein
VPIKDKADNGISGNVNVYVKASAPPIPGELVISSPSTLA